ncbi:dTDP-4-dehydrorhamnose 3,5-epimerase [Nocardiopsis terrae]|uniref:Epimerase EvaD n=1 Tax=Nocardiopsis terrae TaxID=372655 RepID=A0ABR9HAN3_9ACTN|nr:dTDP-4-dehydrorhamnose 3,5-epimerase [Nocardiopsis terrae]MBE1455966.1 epimerase EvaD [Nocardiopsis terrae]GHC96464.1 dTDP-4-dehydrorhamnose 3,5-epimerase [Nocardiopsis terrae]
MRSRPLAVHGAHLFTPDVFPDHRGLFTAPHQREHFEAATGHRPPPVEQLAYSHSRRGVVRGVHFTRTPPGIATLAHCPTGTALDLVVDLRLGSPTFGRFDTVVLSPDDRSSVYLPVGVGHAFVALEEDTVMSYLLSGGYSPADEKAVDVFDPELGLPLPEGITPVASARDRDAPSLAECREAGILPDYAECLRVEHELVGPPPELPVSPARGGE